MNQRHWLNVAEYVAIAASVGGTVATVITQQIMLTTTPLTLALVLNVINRQRQFTKVRQLPEHHKLMEIYDDLISVNGDYRFHKLETQGKLDTFDKNQTTLQSLLEEIKQTWENESKLIYSKLSVLEHDQSDAKIANLNHLYISMNERLNKLEELVKYSKEPSNNYSYQAEVSQTKQSYSTVHPQYNPQELEQLFQNLESEQKLSELDLALLQGIALYLENMSKNIRHYHQDHGASLVEAEIIAKYYLQMSDQAISVQTQQDLKNFIQSVENLKQQVSRYKHENSKCQWSRGLEKEVLDKLKKIK